MGWEGFFLGNGFQLWKVRLFIIVAYKIAINAQAHTESAPREKLSRFSTKLEQNSV